MERTQFFILLLLSSPHYLYSICSLSAACLGFDPPPPRPQNVDVHFLCFEGDVMYGVSSRIQQREMRLFWKWEGSSLSSQSLGSPEDGVWRAE